MAAAPKARKPTPPHAPQVRRRPSFSERAEAWLRSRRRLVLGIVIGVSILLRVIYFSELSRGPCLVAHRWTESDMNFFDRTARTLAGGDWLLNQELHPLFRWQATVAEAYLQQHPQEKARYENATALWNHWLHGKEYHQEPLYAY